MSGVSIKQLSTSQNKYYTKTTFSQTRYCSTSRDRNLYDRSTTPQNYTRSQYDNYSDILDLIVLLIEHTDHLQTQFSF